MSHLFFMLLKFAHFAFNKRMYLLLDRLSACLYTLFDNDTFLKPENETMVLWYFVSRANCADRDREQTIDLTFIFNPCKHSID